MKLKGFFLIINILFLTSLQKTFSIIWINACLGKKAFQQIDIAQIQFLGKSVFEMQYFK